MNGKPLKTMEINGKKIENPRDFPMISKSFPPFAGALQQLRLRVPPRARRLLRRRRLLLPAAAPQGGRRCGAQRRAAAEEAAQRQAAASEVAMRAKGISCGISNTRGKSAYICIYIYIIIIIYIYINVLIVYI